MSHKPHSSPCEATDALRVAIYNVLHFRSRYAPRQRVVITFSGTGRTKQEFKEECDINNIMRKYLHTGQVDHLSTRVARFEDVTGIDFQSAQNMIVEAKELFLELPSDVRSRFGNDPSRLLDFVHDPRNAQEAVKLGFLDAEKLPEALRPPKPQKPHSGVPAASPVPSLDPSAPQPKPSIPPGANPLNA